MDTRGSIHAATFGDRGKISFVFKCQSRLSILFDTPCDASRSSVPELTLARGKSSRRRYLRYVFFNVLRRGHFFFCFERGMLSPCALFTFVWNDLIDKSAYVDISMEFITWEISRGNMVVKWCTFFCFCERKEGFYKRGGPNILFFF